MSVDHVFKASNKQEYIGLIVRKKGSGTNGAEKKVTIKIDNLHSFSREMNGKGILFANYLVSAWWENTSENVIQLFHIPEQSGVTKLMRLRSYKKGPFVYLERFFHPRPGIPANQDFIQQLHEFPDYKFKIPIV